MFIAQPALGASYIHLPVLDDVFIWRVLATHTEVSKTQNHFSDNDISELQNALKQKINKEVGKYIDLRIMIQHDIPERVTFFCIDKKRAIPIAVLDCQVIRSDKYYVRTGTLYFVDLR